MLEWQVKTIKDLGKVVTGKTPSKENDEFYNDGDLPFVSPKDLDWNSYYVYDTQTKVTDKAYESQKNQRIPKNSVFYTSLSFAIGKIGIASRESLTNQQIHSIVVNDKHDYKFVYYLLQQYRPYIFCFNSGIDTPIVPKSVFEKINVVVPDLDVQKKIAAILSAYDDLIENNKKRIQILENMAEELYKEWFVRFRFPNWGNTELEKGVPKGWQNVRFDTFCKFRKGKNPEQILGSKDDDTVKYINMESLTGEGTSYARKQKNSVECRIGDLLMLMDGSRSGLVFKANNMGVVGSTLSIIEVSDTFKNYVFEYLKAMKSSIISNNTGSAIPHANKDYINRMLVCIPDKSIILKFNEIYETQYMLVENLQQQIKQVQRAKMELLPRLISGKLSVEDLDIQFPVSMQE